MVSEKQKRLNSVVYHSSDISKPEGNSKSCQVGKGLISTRSRPNFCIFCRTRHATLACPQLDPVTATSPLMDDPALTSDSPYPDTDAIDAADDPTLSSDSPLDTPPLDTADDATFTAIPDTIPETPAESILNQLQSNDDPLHVLTDSPPSSPSSNTLTEDTHAVPNASAPVLPTQLGPPSATVQHHDPSSAQPTSSTSAPRKRYRTLSGIDRIMSTYNAVLEIQKLTDVSISSACKTNGVGRTTFYRTKCLAELKLVDEARFSNLQAGAKSILELNTLCKNVLNVNYVTKVAEFRRDGRLLPN